MPEIHQTYLEMYQASRRKSRIHPLCVTCEHVLYCTQTICLMWLHYTQLSILYYMLIYGTYTGQPVTDIRSNGSSAVCISTQCFNTYHGLVNTPD